VNCNIKKKDQSHITQVFLPRKHKAKNPTIIYYVYIMDHETISYKTLIQELSLQYIIVSHYHTKIDKFMCQFTASRQPVSSTQSLLMMEILTMNESLGYAFLMGTSNVCSCMSAPTKVRTDSQTVHFMCFSFSLFPLLLRTQKGRCGI
jgi:hypothetical protein